MIIQAALGDQNRDQNQFNQPAQTAKPHDQPAEHQAKNKHRQQQHNAEKLLDHMATFQTNPPAPCTGAFMITEPVEQIDPFADEHHRMRQTFPQPIGIADKHIDNQGKRKKAHLLLIFLPFLGCADQSIL